MRIVSKLPVAAAAAAAIMALVATPALADPPPGVTPTPADIVGAGSGITQNVFDQFSHDYNATHSTGKLYSFDATNPVSGAIGGPIQTKSGSISCKIVRPDGSSAGITALTNTGTTTGPHPCVDFARSALGNPNMTGFIELAKDAVTVATQPGSNAPANPVLLTTGVLAEIYNCTITRWNQIPGNAAGSPATISAFIPQNLSDTRALFLGALGLASPGPCVSSSATRAGTAGNGDNTLKENQGAAPVLNTNKANVILPVSVGNWIAQRFHSASCGTIAHCFAHPASCTPSAGLNLFGCNTHGTMVLNKINGTAPTTGSGKATMINPSFPLTHLLFEVVNIPPGTTAAIPPYLQPYFGPAGFTCSVKARTDLKNYGFLALPGTGPGTCGWAPPPPP